MNQCQLSMVIFKLKIIKSLEWILLEGTRWATCYPTKVF